MSKVPEELGIELEEALEKSADLKKQYDADPETRELYDLAIKIEGLARNVGTHAAAVVIAPSPMTAIQSRSATCSAASRNGPIGPMS